MSEQASKAVTMSEVRAALVKTGLDRAWVWAVTLKATDAQLTALWAVRRSWAKAHLLLRRVEGVA